MHPACQDAIEITTLLYTLNLFIYTSFQLHTNPRTDEKRKHRMHGSIKQCAALSMQPVQLDL